MKKLCLLLALALALSAIPALAAQGDLVLGRDSYEAYMYFNYAFPVGDTLYLPAGGAALYSYRVGDTELTEHTITLPSREATMADDVMPFAMEGELYAIDLISRYDEDSQFEGAKLCRLTPDGDDFILEEDIDLDWDDLVEYYDTGSYPSRPEGIIGLGGKALFRTYDQMGDFVLCAADLATGEVEKMEALQGVQVFTPYRDDTLLVELYDYNDPAVARLVVYDPADGSTQPLAEIEVTEYSPLAALAYDAATDTIYCAKGGEICPVDLQARAVGEGVTDMPLETYGSTTAFVLEGGYYAYASQGVAIRNLDPGQRAASRLKINDDAWNDNISNAYYAFANAHGDVSTVLSRDWTEAQNLLEDMMNHDDSIDIYVLTSDNRIYDALYKRGYLMELDGSKQVQALAERMYPSIREEISTDGHIVALPVGFYSWTFGVNERALEALGLSMEDVPDNWMDFLDFVRDLEGPLSEHGNIHLFYAGYTDREARNDIFNSLFEDYQRYVNVVNPDAGYNTPLLRELLTKLEAIDFVALGCPQAQESEDDVDEPAIYMETADYSEDSTVLQPSIGCTFGNFYSSFTPLLLGLDADTPMPLILRTTLAFVNPYTKNPEMALAFMDALADHLDQSTLYTLDPSLNEAVRGAQNEQNLKEARQMLEEAQQMVDEADESDRQMLEENLRNMQESVDYWEKYAWDVSQRELDWFRGHDDDIALDRVNWLYADETGEAWELISQYEDHAIGVDELLAGIDRKAQMMRLEGN